MGGGEALADGNERADRSARPSLQRPTVWTLRADAGDAKQHVSSRRGRYGQAMTITQIYEGTNQIQRVVIARILLR